MTTILLVGFQGANQAVNPRDLPAEVGTDSVNQRPGRNDLRPWRRRLPVATVPPGRSTIYRMGRDVASDSDFWLSWSADVDVARSFVARDVTERTYFTGDGPPKVTDSTLALATAPFPTTARLLGVPVPVSQPLVSQVTPGTGDEETVFFVHTFVNSWGEEGASSPVSEPILRRSGATLEIQGLDAPPDGNWAITTRRIYGTIAGNGNDAEFFLLKEVPVGAASVTIGSEQADGILTSSTHLPPPEDLRGLTTLWNGTMAGISGKTVRFCETNLPYAWPAEFFLPFSETPVALAAWQQNLIVLTNGSPYLVTGSAPDAMSSQRLEIDQSCVSKRSVVEMGHGVCWASPDGLVYTGQFGTKMVTSGLLMTEDWRALRPETMHGAYFEGRYFCFGGARPFFIDPVSPTGIYFLSDDAQAAFTDKLRDSLFLLSGPTITKWDAAEDFLLAEFLSKRFRAPKPCCMAVAQVVADSYPVQFRLLADGQVRHTQSVMSPHPFRLPAGYLADDWQIGLTSSGPVHQAVVSTSIEELRAV